MREGHRRAIRQEVMPPEPWPACRPPSPAYLSNNKNQDKSYPPDLSTLLTSVCFVLLSSLTQALLPMAWPHQRFDWANRSLTFSKGGLPQKAPEQGKYGQTE
jgi:hypothetical protein